MLFFLVVSNLERVFSWVNPLEELRQVYSVSQGGELPRDYFPESCAKAFIRGISVGGVLGASYSVLSGNTDGLMENVSISAGSFAAADLLTNIIARRVAVSYAWARREAYEFYRHVLS